jgi:hypothetical protein
VYQFNNSVASPGKLIGSEEFFVQMVETLDINIQIDVLKEDLVKGRSKP